VFVQKTKQFNHRYGCQFHVLLRVKPKTTASKTEVNVDGTSRDAGERFHCHGRLARGAWKSHGGRYDIVDNKFCKCDSK
jgi:hypothetical protein